MTTWNYRIVKYRDQQGFGLHEVFYNDNGKPEGMTEKPIGFACGLDEGPEGIIKSLKMALKDARKPVLNEPETWPDL